MNVRCPHCESTFRVDPERVPPNGVKARCSRCSNIFQLTRDGVTKTPEVTAAAQPAAVGTPVTPQPPAPPAMAPPPVSAVIQPPMAPPAVTPRPIPTTPPAVTPAPADATRVAMPAAAAASPKRPSFRNQDPGARAQRLARALVSDIVAYNKDKLKQTAGADPITLRAEFRDEIRKSWEEYVEQVGIEMAKSTPYFRDALNEILAQGQKIF